MEEIYFITTPPCSKCVPDKSFNKRYACKGCEKLMVTQSASRPGVKRKSVGLSKSERIRRDGKIIELKKSGYSYGQIAKLLQIPRSTAQATVLRSSEA